MYADKATEQKLVQAIKEAAQRIDYSSTTDPEAILAECLMSRGLSEGFAKTASDALNKSYSVYYMSTHDDSSRGNDHTLLDSDKVKMHMCKEDTPVCPKTSKPIEDTPDVVVKRVTTVQKAASVNTQTHEKRTFNSTEDYLGWLSNNMLKVARGYSELTADTNAALEQLYNRHNKLKSADLDNYTVQCLYKQGNKQLNDFMDTLGLHQETSKVAMIGTSMVGSIKPVVPVNDTSKAIYGLYKDSCVVKTATLSVKYTQEHLRDINEGLQELINKYDKNCLMGKSAAVDASDKNLAGVASGIAFSPMALLGGAIGGVPGALSNVAENARMMREINDKPVSDASVIDAQLMTEDRRVKNLEAWSEVAADPDLARYPITDLFEVTQKLIKANPQFERPDMAPMLVDTVSQVMSQGSRIGLALHGATAKTISDIAKGRTNVTGNDIYDIRSGITGKQELVQGISPSSLYADNLATAGELFSSGTTAVATSIKDNISSLAQKYLSTEARIKAQEQKLKKRELKSKLDDIDKKLKEKPYRDQVEREEREIKDLKRKGELNRLKDPARKQIESDKNITELYKGRAAMSKARQTAVEQDLREKGLGILLQTLKNDPKSIQTMLKNINARNAIGSVKLK